MYQLSQAESGIPSDIIRLRFAFEQMHKNVSYLNVCSKQFACHSVFFGIPPNHT